MVKPIAACKLLTYTPVLSFNKCLTINNEHVDCAQLHSQEVLSTKIKGNSSFVSCNVYARFYF